MCGSSVIFSFIFSAFVRRLRSQERSKNASRFLSWSISASSSVVSQPTTRKSSWITCEPVRPSTSWFIVPGPLRVGSLCQALYELVHCARPSTSWLIVPGPLRVGSLCQALYELVHCARPSTSWFMVSGPLRVGSLCVARSRVQS